MKHFINLKDISSRDLKKIIIESKYPLLKTDQGMTLDMLLIIHLFVLI